MSSSAIFSQNVQMPSISTASGALTISPESGVVSANADLTFTESARVIQVARSTDGAGDPLTVAAGSGLAGGNTVAGGTLTLKPGVSTGAAAAKIVLQAPTINTSATTDNAMVDRVWVPSRKNITATSTVGTTIFTVDVPDSGKSMGWQVHWTVTVVGTTVGAVPAIGSYSGYSVGAVNNIGATITVGNNDFATTASAVSGSATLTAASDAVYAADTSVPWRIIPTFAFDTVSAAYIDYVAIFMGNGAVED